MLPRGSVCIGQCQSDESSYLSIIAMISTCSSITVFMLIECKQKNNYDFKFCAIFFIVCCADQQ